ncbi:MAG: hypothetical protein WC679_14095 [Bacteroidales bacterium]|jgi:hypothetical protein
MKKPTLPRCPHCKKELECLKYNQEVTEFGEATPYISERGTCCDIDYESNDSESGESEYFCPECEKSIDETPDDFFYDYMEELKKEKAKSNQIQEYTDKVVDDIVKKVTKKL